MTRRLIAAVLTASLIASAPALLAQRRRGGFGMPMRMASDHTFDGSFTFCRVVFSQNPDGDGNGWFVDYPRADANLSTRLSELTKTHISRDASGEPNYVLVRLTDDALFQCPFIMMTEPGGAYFRPEEAARLRDYLLKGGFLWADDFWGSYAWDVWVREFSKVLPPTEYPIADIPLSHPIFRSQFEIKKFPQIPSIGVWRMGTTSERGADSAEPHLRGVADRHGRLMAIMTHNTDFGDAFEEEATDPRYFYTFSVDGYAFGINVLLYSMTH